MKRADLALLLSVVSAGITSGGLAWQLVLYRLSGSRLIVELIPAMTSLLGPLTEGRPGRWRARLTELTASERWTVELAHVRVTNIGRTAISVSDVSLDFGRVNRWRLRSRLTTRGRPVNLSGSTDAEVIRLDAGEAASVYFDVWPMVERARGLIDGTITVRASVKPAGRRATRSSRRTGWVVRPGQAAMDPNAPADGKLRAYRVLWRALRHDADLAALTTHAWYSTQELLPNGSGVVAAKLGEVIPAPELPPWLAREMVDAYQEGRRWQLAQTSPKPAG